MAKPTSDDDGALSHHTQGIPVGRVRPATLEEDLKRETLLRPDAVLALKGPLPNDLGPFEAHIANLIDGVRPVARIRKKSGVSSADLRIALGVLVDKNLVRLAGIVEEAIGQLAKDIAADVANEDTMTKARPDVVPPHVMAEIKAAMDDEED